MFAQLSDPQFMLTLLVGIAVFATIITLAMPFLAVDKLNTRIRAVASERAALRSDQHKRLMESRKQQASLRDKPSGGLILDVVRLFNLRKMLETQETRARLRMAGLRRESHVYTFLFFRLVSPVLAGLVSFAYLRYISGFGLSPVVQLVTSLGCAWLGFYLPNIFVSNLIQRRQDSIKLAFSDALDLLLICVESGMSIEAAFNRVAEEIGVQSIPLAEEMTLTTAELSYLQDRRQAYENLGKRTGLNAVRGICTSLIQAERYGTPLGQALRVMAQENRDMRMAEAEKKAAGLPPKLTVPMIAFFLPVLFVVILGPAAIQVMGLR